MCVDFCLHVVFILCCPKSVAKNSSHLKLKVFYDAFVFKFTEILLE